MWNSAVSPAGDVHGSQLSLIGDVIFS